RQTGLSVLTEEQVRSLLTQPVLLWDLQEDLLIHGGPYWEARFAENAISEEELARGWERLQRGLLDSSSSPDSSVEPSIRTETATSGRDETVWYRRPWIVSLATAAGVLFAVSLWDTMIMPP